MKACLTLALILVLSACANTPSTSPPSWSDHQPAEYVAETCTHGVEPPGCIRAAVAGGKVAQTQERIFSSVIVADAGSSGTAWEDIAAFEPIQDMFDSSSHPKAGCTLKSRSYDKTYGYVSDFKLSCDGSLGGRYVTCFKPGATEIEACAIEP